MSVVLVRRILISSFIALVLLIQPIGASDATGLQTTWTCDGVPATLVGTPGADSLTGTEGADVIVARQGDDTIRALGGDDLVCAGKGNDTVFGGGGFDILFGAQGNDSLYAANGSDGPLRADSRGARMFGGVGDDLIFGSNRWDRMQGGPGNDELQGYEGRDWLRAGPNTDVVDGGPGIDDQHGGNGPDTIRVTAGDIVRGGAGLDLCTILNGEPALFRSCGRNVREKPPASTFELSTCTNTNGEFTNTPATGLVTNRTGSRADIFVTVRLADANGVQFGEAFNIVDNVEPGETARWEANTSDDIGRTAECVTSIEVNDVAPWSFPGATYNVTITSCGQGPIGTAAIGQVTNTSSVVSDLFVYVYGFDQNGIRQARDLLALVEGVQPGQPVEYEASSFGEVPAGGFSRCSAFVNNFDV